MAITVGHCGEEGRAPAPRPPQTAPRSTERSATVRRRSASANRANGPREPDAEHHLALRYDPEPAIRASTDAVRAELARLKTAC